MKHTFLLLLAFVVTGWTDLRAGDSEEGFTPLCNGKTFTGWQMSTDNTNTWKLEDGAFVARGPVAHLYYMGDPKAFKNFELKVDVTTETNSNGGIYFHTTYQEKGFPRAGLECQVNVSHRDWIKTGSLYGLVNIGQTPAKDNQTWTQHIIVRESKVTVKIDGTTVLEYNEPPGAKTGGGRKLGEGTFALQAHDPKSIIRYQNIRAKRLD